jgi:hypothetical protein
VGTPPCFSYSRLQRLRSSWKVGAFASGIPASTRASVNAWPKGVGVDRGADLRAALRGGVMDQMRLNTLPPDRLRHIVQKHLNHPWERQSQGQTLAKRDITTRYIDGNLHASPLPNIGGAICHIGPARCRDVLAPGDETVAAECCDWVKADVLLRTGHARPARAALNPGRGVTVTIWSGDPRMPRDVP